VPLRLSASFAFVLEPRSKRGTYIEALENKVTEIIPRVKSEGVRGGWGELHGQLNVSYIYICIYLFTAIGLLPGGSGYFTCKQNMKLVLRGFC